MFLSVCFLSFYCLRCSSHTAKDFVGWQEAAAWLEHSAARRQLDTSKLEADGRDIPQLVPIGCFFFFLFLKQGIKKKKKAHVKPNFSLLFHRGPFIYGAILTEPDITRRLLAFFPPQSFPRFQITSLLEAAQDVPTLSHINGVAKEVCHFIIQPRSRLLTAAASRTQMEPWMINQINHRWCNSLPTTHNNQKVCNAPLMNYLYGWAPHPPPSSPTPTQYRSLSELKPSSIDVKVAGFFFTITQESGNIFRNETPQTNWSEWEKETFDKCGDSFTERHNTKERHHQFSGIFHIYEAT